MRVVLIKSSCVYSRIISNIREKEREEEKWKNLKETIMALTPT